jgi:hypothetical protein
MLRCQKIISIMNLFRTRLFVLLFLVSTQIMQAQVIVNDSFENTTTLFTNSGGTYYSGNTGGSDGPANSPQATLGTYGIGVNNGSAIFTSTLVNVSTCNSLQLSFNLTSISLTSATNGADGTDYVRVEVSPDGGTTYYNTLQINGNSNAYWSYAATGVASTSYDGNVTPVTFAPAGGGNRTTDGYSSVVITGLPSVSNLRVRITLLNNASNERWVIDNFVLSGTCVSCTAPTTTLSVLSQTVCSDSANTMSVSTNASSPSYTWQASANGTSGWNTATNNTPAGSSYSGVNTSVLSLTAASTYYYRVLVSESGTCTATSSTSTLVVNTPVTITTQPISVSTTSTGTASYTVLASGTGNTYQWQQNSGSGFTNFLNGGTNPTYAGATTSVLTISNPPLSMSGYSYQCIVSNPCNTLTTNGTATITVTTALTCPYLISAVINSCNGCADEGNNEFLVLNSGSYSFSVTPTNVRVTYSNGPTNLTSSFAAQPTSLATLNTATMNACGTTFVDVSNGTIAVPPNSTLLIINKGACFTGDWSEYCGLGTVYVAFSSATAWSTTGFFGNNNTARTFVTDFSAINSSCGNTTYAYNQSGVAGTPFSFGSDGASVLFNGSAPPTYVVGNGNCAPPNIILPITLLDFYAVGMNEANEITWKVADELNIQKYIIEKSADGFNFEILNSIIPNEQNSYETKSYRLLDNYPYNTITYYRLNTQEADGSIHHINTISVSELQNNLEVLIYQNEELINIDFKNSLQVNSTIQLFDLTGKLLFEQNVEQSLEQLKVSEYAKGIYFLRIHSKEKIINQKIVIH